MAEPVTISLAIASMVASAGGAVMQARAAKQEAKTEASWQEYNAAVAMQEAKTRDQQAGVESSDARKQAKAALASQRVAYNAAGIDFAGSPLAVMEESAANMERSILEVSRRGYTEAEQLRSQAGINLFQAQTAKLKGRNQRNAIYGNAAASIAGQGATLASRYAEPKKVS